jgi:hypothetical protein
MRYNDQGQRIVFRAHALRRMFQRKINGQDIRRILETGQTIETYPHDSPYPSRLILGWCEGRPLHVVVADNEADHEIVVITVYEPNPEQWMPDFKRRKA